jgi:hypothetical protein
MNEDFDTLDSFFRAVILDCAEYLTESNPTQK